MSRGPLDHSVTLLLDADEHDFFDHLKGTLGIGGDANLIRLALYHLARFADVPIGLDTFAARTHVDERAYTAAQRRMRA